MEHSVLNFLCSYHKKLKKHNKRFARKVQSINAVKDSFYVHALNLWNEEDELLKCQLAIEINCWVEEIAEDVGLYRRQLLTGILRNLAACGLREHIFRESWRSYFIRCGINETHSGRCKVTKFLTRNIIDQRKGMVYIYNKKLKMERKAEAISKILDRLVEKIQNDEDTYLALVDGSYWEELAEIIQNSEKQIQTLLIEMIAHIRSRCAISVPTLHQNHMEYVRNALSELRLNCLLYFENPYDKAERSDRFGLLMIYYITYRANAADVLMLMPSWVKFSKSRIENKKMILDETYVCAPGSHFYWFCSFALGVRNLLEKNKNLSSVDALLEVLRLGIFGSSSNRLYAIKYINSNMPPDTEATLLLKNEVRILFENKRLLDAVMEYTYYLSCLNEPIGISEKRRSWFIKNIEYIFSNYEEFLNALRRVFVGIFKNDKNNNKDVLDKFDFQREQFLEKSEAPIVASNIDLDSSDLAEGADLERVRHEWQCFKNKVWIQTDLDNPDRLTEVNEDNAIGHLEKYLSKGAMDSMIEPRYILNSLCDYMQLKEHDLHHRYPVWIDDVQWAKIRKRKVRLLIRSIRDDLVFHAYKRKDYHSGMFD